VAVFSGGDGFSELDVEVLRIVAFHERWQCLGEDGCAVDFAADADAPLSEVSCYIVRGQVLDPS